MSKVSKSEIIRNLYDAGKSVKEIKSKVKCSHALIAVVLRNYKAKKKARKSKIVKAVEEMNQVLNVVEKKPTKLIVQPQYKAAALKLLDMKEADLVNHPPHYRTGGIDYWDFAEAKGLTENAYLFNAGKYIVRCGKKEGADPIQDLEKAIKFIQRDIDRRKNA